MSARKQWFYHTRELRVSMTLFAMCMSPTNWLGLAIASIGVAILLNMFPRTRHTHTPTRHFSQISLISQQHISQLCDARRSLLRVDKRSRRCAALRISAAATYTYTSSEYEHLHFVYLMIPIGNENWNFCACCAREQWEARFTSASNGEKHRLEVYTLNL